MSRDFLESWEAFESSCFLIITFLRQCALVSEEETTKLENPRIYRVEQHLIILTMKALIIFILIVVIQCLTGKFNMDMSFLC